MNTNLKKFLIIVIVILIIVLAGLLVYDFLIKKTDNDQANQDNNLPDGQQEDQNQDQDIQSESKIKAISSEAIFSPTISSDKLNVVYYFRSNGNVWQSNFDGANLNQISATNLENLVKVLWSPSKTKAVTIFQDNLENVSKYLYDYTTNKSSPLSKYLNFISWSSDGKKIAYQYQNDFTDDNNISTSNPDGSKFTILLNIRMKNLIVEWTSDIYLREKPSGLAQSTLYSLNPLSKALNKLISDVYGFSVKWSQKGDKILYSKTNSKGQNIEIFTANNNGANEKSAGVSTLAEKCAWSQDTRFIYCAIPVNINSAKVLPDDFYKGTFIGDDGFYKINTATGEKTNIMEGEMLRKAYDATDLFLSPQENYLMFINKGDGLLYSIKL